jgi:hypothetical protein
MDERIISSNDSPMAPDDSNVGTGPRKLLAPKKPNEINIRTLLYNARITPKALCRKVYFILANISVFEWS